MYSAMERTLYLIILSFSLAHSFDRHDPGLLLKDCTASLALSNLADPELTTRYRTFIRVTS